MIELGEVGDSSSMSRSKAWKSMLCMSHIDDFTKRRVNFR